ncbi:MAG: non-canonical purine NTP pyrophosphatase [Bacteroidales bacterium]|nr:non-canonical purine NTP pyrophosphatase [Bacteroidales bacterium]
MKLVFATGNKGKLREASEILGDEFELLSSAQAGVTEDVEETGLTLKDNSIIKAEYIFSKTGLDCFADDTGLEVDALGGAPGVFTARYAGEGCNFDDNIRKLLSELARLDPSVPRTARFRSVVTLIIGGEKHFFEGVMEGKIALEKAGCGGFGYDPVFIASLSREEALDLLRECGIPAEGQDWVDRLGECTVAEMPEEIKNAISHRGRALRAMAAWLRTSAK